MSYTDEELRNELVMLYLGEQMSQKEIAIKYGVTHVIIKRYLKKYGIPTRNHKESNQISNSGYKNSKWIGGRTIKPSGYVMVYSPDHPNASKNYVYEHRLVMEKNLKRYLRKDEHVHHIDGNKLNNRLNNLEVLSSSEHAKKHSGNHVPHMNRVRVAKHKLV